MDNITLEYYRREVRKWRDSAERRLQRENKLKGELFLRCEQLRFAYEELEQKDRTLKRLREILDLKEPLDLSRPEKCLKNN